MRKFITDLFTESDNKTGDQFRFWFAACMTVFLIGVGYVVFKTGTFDMQSFANAFAVIFGSGAAGTGIKSKLEGPAVQTPQASQNKVETK